MKYFSRKRPCSLYTDNNIWILTWSDYNYKSSLLFKEQTGSDYERILMKVLVMVIEVVDYLVSGVGV